MLSKSPSLPPCARFHATLTVATHAPDLGAPFPLSLSLYFVRPLQTAPVLYRALFVVSESRESVSSPRLVAFTVQLFHGR